MIDRKLISTKTKSKKGYNSARICQMITNIELDLYFIAILSSAKFEWNLCLPSKVFERNEKCDDDTDDVDDANDDDYAGDTKIIDRWSSIILD